MADKITENTTIFEALQINPNAGDILMKNGMHCLGCALAHGETIGAAADVHGADPQKMLDDNGELVILKVEEEDGEEYFVDIEDDDEYNMIVDAFTDRLQDTFEIEEAEN